MVKESIQSEEAKKSGIIVPESFFPSVENYGHKLRVYTLYEKYLEENVRKIYDRLLVNLEHTTLSQDEQRDSRQIIKEILYKLGAAIYHFNQFRQLYLEIEKIVEDSRDTLPQFDQIHFDVPRLGYEVESLFFQLKSTLDVLIKILPLAFKIKISFRSFGEKGNKVIKTLENNLSEKSLKRVKIGAKNIIALIKESQSEGFNDSKGYGWLKLMIDLRDEMTHKEKSNIFFIIDKNEDGSVTIHPPKISREQTYFEMLEILIYNAVRFVEEFLLHSIGCVLKPDKRIAVVKQRKFRQDWVWCNDYDWVLSASTVPKPVLDAVKKAMGVPKDSVVKKVIDDHYLVGT